MNLAGVAVFGSQLLVSKYDRQDYIRMTLCEFSIYVLHLTVLCMITFGMVIPSSYYYTNVVSNLFLDTPIGEGYTTFRTSTQITDFWGFAETTMVKGLYWKYWYGVVDPNYIIPPQHQGVLHENRLLGRPRLRQIRVRIESCPISDKFNRLFRVCYPPYSWNHEETGSYNPLLGGQDAWKHHSAQSLDESFYWGNLATYSGGGAFQKLGSDEPETLQFINELKNNLWISRATRVVFLDFTLYNANVNLFCVVKLVWEFPATGGLITSSSIRSIRLIRYSTPYEYFILVMEFIYVVFTVYYTIQEFYEMFNTKCSKYFTNFWNILDLSSLLISYICIAFSICRHVLMGDMLQTLLADPNKYGNFYWIALWESQYNTAIAICLFLAWVKLFKYISINRTLSQLSSTVSRCAKDIGGFAIMFFIVFFAFAQLGFLLFGSVVYDFRTFPDTAFSLLRLILGDFDYRAIDNANKVLGPIFFVTYVFFVFFVLLNMFLAIINDTYSEVKAEIQSHPEEFQVTDFLKQKLNNLYGGMGCRSKKVDIQTQIKLANTDNIITVQEIRENLRRSNFTDVEVEMFLTRYELDEDRPIDEEEADNVLGSLEGHHAVSGRDLEEFPKPEKSDAAKLTDEEISELQTRVGMLESSLTQVSRKMDNLLNKIDSLDRQKSSVRGGVHRLSRLSEGGEKATDLF